MARKKRRSPMKGWAKAKPGKVGERDKLYARCRRRCFMLPKEKKYPVCSKQSRGCKPDCRGLLAAVTRGKANYSKASSIR